MVRKYSMKSDAADKVSEHFRLREFASRDGADEVLIDDALLDLLEAIRSEAGDKAITINSGYRSPAHNKAVGGVSNSQHVKGTAADIVVEDTDPLTVGQIAEYILGNRGGIGVYTTFTHVDVRANKSRWDQRSGHQVVVAGWPGWKEDDEMLSYEQWKEYMEQYRKELQDNECGAWSKNDRDWAVSTGLMAGGDPLPDGEPNYMWRDFLTREQAATLFHRYDEMQ